MKKLLLSFSLVFLTVTQILADCMSEGIWAYSSQHEIKQNSLIMVVGYAQSQKIVSALGKKYAIYLETAGHRVALKALEMYQSTYELTQVLFKPSEKLQVGKTYALSIRNTPEHLHKGGILTRWNSKTSKRESVRWKVSKGQDTSTPGWITQPRFAKTTFDMFGCGPEMYAIFDTQIKNASKVWIKTQVMDITTQKSYTYYLRSKGGKIKIGHGMCSGEFSFMKKHQYKVRFSLQSISGKTRGPWTQWISFKNPQQGL